MERKVEYRGYQIHIELRPVSEEMFDVWFHVDGPMNSRDPMAQGSQTKIRNGPFSQRWAYLVGEIAGQAAVDAMIDVPK